jgi:hypothetical protein
VAGLLGIAPRAAWAKAPIVVTTMADVVNGSDSVLSLREAVTKANADAGADTIVLSGPPSEYDLTICDVTGADDDANLNGDLDVTDPAGLSIGAKTYVVQKCPAESEERVFEVAAGAALDLHELKVTGGHGATDYLNGGVAIGVGLGGRLSLDTVLVEGNGRVTADVNQGGIVVGSENSVLSITHSAVVGNQNATGVMSFGSASLVDSLVAENTAPKADAGGLYGNFDLTRTEVSDDVGENFGGGLVLGDVVDFDHQGQLGDTERRSHRPRHADGLDRGRQPRRSPRRRADRHVGHHPLDHRRQHGRVLCGRRADGRHD